MIEEIREKHDLKPAAELAPPFEPSKPRFAEPPEGFIPVANHVKAGVRVLKNLDTGTSAIQFSDDRVPTREEKDRMEEAGLGYDPSQRQWTKQDAELPGANLIKVREVGREIAEARAEGRGR
ncbi:hypothetical protein [Paludisphaera sp.]|uniref:hypothetical protein n=1 Tax=Paludisphaera sp. TaxID=2017432 RepID=UPI00301E35F6